MTKPKSSTSKEQGTRNKEQVELLQNVSSSGLTRGSSPAVGEQLKVRRIELGLDLHAVEVATKIRGRYLRAIESSSYSDLPNDIYTRGFVRTYAAYLGLPVKSVMARYEAERGKTKPTQRVKPQQLEARMSVTTRWLVSIGALVALVAIVGYFIWQFSSLTAAPHITLKEPAGDKVVSSTQITVKGSATPGSDVYLNDTLLPSDVNGGFETTLILQPGVNTVRLLARNKLGKQTLLTRNVLSQQSAAVDVPAALFDGVAVRLHATKATAIVVQADGKQLFSGTLATGSDRLFTAASTMSVGSDNLNNLQARLTNTQVASYNWGALAPNAQPNAQVVFEKNTTPSPIR